MPKAAVNKYSKSLFHEDEIWLAEERITAAPTGDVAHFKYLNQAKFSPSISRAFYRGHHRRALGLVKDIHDGCYVRVFARASAIVVAWRLINSGGRALPIISAMACLPRATGNRYPLGKDCSNAASRIVMARSCSG